MNYYQIIGLYKTKTKFVSRVSTNYEKLFWNIPFLRREFPHMRFKIVDL